VDLGTREREFFAGTLAAEPIAPEGFGEHGIRHRYPHAGLFLEEGSHVYSPRVFGGRIFWGAHSYIGTAGYVRGDTFVGRYCSIGRSVSIGATHHPFSGLSTSPRIKGTKSRRYTEEQQRLVRPTAPRKNCLIESDVWIGDGAVVLAGTRLATGCIVGANAVVARDVAPYEIVGGVPARHIGYRFDPSVVARLLASGWWELAREQINAFPTANVFEYLDAAEGASPAGTYRVFSCAA
jgi:virginiamycin A acetyltransferase